MNRHTFRTALPSAIVAAALLTAPVSAEAATKTFPDAKNDVANSNNIVNYTVNNGSRITVATRHKNLTKKALDIQFLIRAKGMKTQYTVYAATNGTHTGVYNKRWMPQECAGVKVTRNLKKNRLALSVPRTCVGNPKGKVRVRVRVQWTKNGAKGDWAPNQGYSPWVGR